MVEFVLTNDFWCYVTATNKQSEIIDIEVVGHKLQQCNARADELVLEFCKRLHTESLYGSDRCMIIYTLPSSKRLDGKVLSVSPLGRRYNKMYWSQMARSDRAM